MIRLMKVKSMILEQALEERRAETEKAVNAFAPWDPNAIKT